MLTVRLGAHDSRLAHLLGPAAAASLAPGALTPEYAHVNQWLAVTILDALDKTALIVTNLVAKMPATKLTDGHHLFRAICDLDALSPSQIAHAENAFKDLKLLTMGMSDVACEAACRTLLRRHEILPCNKGCDDTTKMAMFLDKMPDELRKDSADLKTQLCTGVVTGKAPWSIDTLIQVIAIHLAKGAARLTAHSGMSDDPTAHLGDDKKKECLNCSSTAASPATPAATAAPSARHASLPSAPATTVAPPSAFSPRPTSPWRSRMPRAASSPALGSSTSSSPSTRRSTRRRTPPMCPSLPRLKPRPPPPSTSPAPTPAPCCPLPQSRASPRSPASATG